MSDKEYYENILKQIREIVINHNVAWQNPTSNEIEKTILSIIPDTL